MKVALASASATVRGTFVSEGSILQGTARARSSFLVELSLQSNAPRDTLENLVGIAHASCYAEATIREPVHLEIVNRINGDAYVQPGS